MPLILFGLVCAFAVMLLFGGMELDRGLLLIFYAGEREDVAAVARFVTELGGALVLLAVTAVGTLLLLLRRDWRGAAQLAAITLSGRLAVDLLKGWTNRIRPEDHHHLVEVQSLAFPSGHAANATLVWLCLALLIPRTPRGCLFAVWGAAWLAIAVGASRVVLGVHWPSDVIAGWTLGLFWTLALLRLSGGPLAEGTPRPPAHSFPVKEEDHGRPPPPRRS